jgi:DNA repair and recombination protein RAD52
MSFTDEQKAALAAPLSREHVKTRQQSGRSLSYMEGWRYVAEANRIFGFDGWDRELIDLKMVVEAQTKLNSGADAWRVAYIAKVRIRLIDAITREGIGYGSGIDRDQGAAHESAVKEAETDAMKRALMTFGNQFGLALYDKEQTEVVDNRSPAQPAAPLPADDRAASRVAPDGGENRGASPDDSDLAIARATFRRIKSVIVAQKLPEAIDQVLDLNKADMLFLAGVAKPGHEELLSLAAARKTELRASA